MSDKPNFLRDLERAMGEGDNQPPPLPTPAYCDECLSVANPTWGRGTEIYCRDCAPEDLKNPQAARKETTNDLED